MNGVKFWCYNAGHVLGAAMFMMEIAGVKVSCWGQGSPASWFQPLRKPMVTCFNSLWPGDAIWRHRSESAMAWVPDGTKPLLEAGLTYHSPEENFTTNAQNICS